MPQYIWKGITIFGESCQGTMDARTLQALEQKLFDDDIALIESCVKLPWLRFRGPSTTNIVSFFESFATLVEAGIFVDGALQLLSQTTAHPGLKIVVHDIYIAVHDGVSLSQAMSPYEALFGQSALAFIAAGEQTASLACVLRSIQHYYANQALFHARIRDVAVVPLITFCFFLMVAAIIVGYVIPSFATMFLSVKKDIPTITRIVLGLSQYCTIFYAMSAFGCIVGCLAALRKIATTRRGKIIVDRCILGLPIAGPCIIGASMHQFLQTAGLLMNGGIHEVVALKTAYAGINNSCIRLMLQSLVKQVEGGESIIYALKTNSCGMSSEVQSILAVGEVSNTLGNAFGHAAGIYKKLVESQLKMISSLVQPCLMIILGLCITALLFAVYMPVLQLSYVIT